MIQRYVLPALILFMPLNVRSDDTRRSCVAFCVGIEDYQVDDSLNNLEFTAEDAYRVWQTLQAITNMDGRSRLLVVNRVDRGDLPTDPDARRNTLKGSEVRELLKQTLRTVDDGDLVFIYLGGHGIKNEQSSSVGVSYAGTDCIENGLLGAIKVNELLGEIRSFFGSRKQVQVVFVGNFCHAGGVSTGVMSAKKREELKSILKSSEGDHKYAVEMRNLNLAYIPATSNDSKTYERKNLGGSELAHHLINGLKGGGVADNETRTITSGSLLEYLQANLNSVPENLAGFKRDIEIANVREHEAEVRFTLGTGLIATALDIPSRVSENRDSTLTSDSIYDDLLRLAEAQFELHRDLTSKNYLPSMIRQWQCRRLRHESVSLLTEEIKQLVFRENQKHSPKLKAVVTKLKQAAQSEDSAQRCVVAIVPSGEPLDSRLGTQENNEIWIQKGKKWLEYFYQYPGCRDVLPVWNYPSWGALAKRHINQRFSNDGPSLKDFQDVLTQEVMARFEEGSDLILVFTGHARFALPNDNSPVLMKDHYDWISNVFKAWNDRSGAGRTILVWDAPFGGQLKEVRAKHGDIPSAMLLGSGEQNGLSFYGGQYDHTNALFDSIQGKLSKEVITKSIEQLKEELGILLEEPKQYSWVLGTPEWIGEDHEVFHGGSPVRSVDVLDGVPLPSKWWGIDFGFKHEISSELFETSETAGSTPQTRTLTSLDELLAQESNFKWAAQKEDLLERNETNQIHDFELLTLAGLQEVSGQLTQSHMTLIEFLRRIDSWELATPTSYDVIKKSRRRSIARLRKVKKNVELRNPITESKIHVVGIGANQYQSVLVGDLRNPKLEVDAWVKSLDYAFPGRIHSDGYQIEQATRELSIQAIRRAISRCRDTDVICVYFSGRGFQIGRDRYLVFEDYEFPGFKQGNLKPSETVDERSRTTILPSQSIPTPFDWPFHEISDVANSDSDVQSGAIISLSEIANLLNEAKGKSIVLVDCQFVSPEVSQLLPTQKHLMATQAFTRENRTKQTKRQIITGEKTKPNILRVSEEPFQNLVVIWWNDILHDQPRDEISDFSRGLLTSLRESPHLSYSDWVNGTQSKNYSLQGNVEWPIFSPKTDEPYPPHLINQLIRQEANLLVCLDVLELASDMLLEKQDELVRLGLNTLYTKKFQDDAHNSRVEIARDQINGSPLMRELTDEDVRRIELDIFGTYVRLVTNAHRVNDEPVKALDVVLQALRVGNSEWLEREPATRIEEIIYSAIYRDRKRLLGDYLSRVPAGNQKSEHSRRLKSIRHVLKSFQDAEQRFDIRSPIPGVHETKTSPKLLY